eukprot:scaffold41379_cov71-Phaeocystis_antarctica.AAC.13
MFHGTTTCPTTCPISGLWSTNRGSTSAASRARTRSGKWSCAQSRRSQMFSLVQMRFSLTDELTWNRGSNSARSATRSASAAASAASSSITPKKVAE